MRLKTKLVLAITMLVFLIAGMLSLVYVFELLHSAVQQSYDTNRMVADQVRLAVQQRALETGLERPQVDPNNPAELRDAGGRSGAQQCRAAGGDGIGQPLFAYRLRHQHRRQPVDAPLLSTNPDNEDKPLPQRPNYSQLAGRESDRTDETGLRPAAGV